jgi:hypothetical protein
MEMLELSPPKTRTTFILLLAIAAIQVLVAALFLVNLSAILTTTRLAYHGPSQDLNSFLAGLSYGVPIEHVFLALVFGFLASAVWTGKKWAPVTTSIASVVVIVGAILFSTSGYLRIFPSALVPYVMLIMIIESLLMAAASISLLIQGTS